MEPALHAGERYMVESLSRHFLPPRRGEVLVIRNPHNKSVVEIKRVVGLPNEEVTLGQNSVTVTHQDGRSETFGPPIGLPQTEPFHIKLGPEDYLLLGDNRSKSSDSRTFGAVQSGDIIGRPVVRFEPLPRFSLFPRL